MKLLMKLFLKVHVFLYRFSRGRVGSQIAGQPVLLLRTVGRKSGKEYITPLSYCRIGECFVIVAANFGHAKHPAWFLNLVHRPATSIQVKDRVVEVCAHQAKADKHVQAWKFVTRQNKHYLQYQQQTSRKLPVVFLVPSNIPFESEGEQSV